MDLDWSETQLIFADGVAGRLRSRFGRTELRDLVAAGEAGLATCYRGEPDWYWLLAEESAGLADAALLAELAGRALLPGILPFHLATTFALRRQGYDLTSHDESAELSICIPRSGLDGALVPTSPACTAALTIADPRSGCQLVGLAGSEPGGLIDFTRSLTLLTVPAPAGVRWRGQVSVFETAAAAARCLLAAEMLGSMTALIELAGRHAVTRRQFGRPLSDFQAIQHRLADMLIAYQTSRSLVYQAVWTVEEGQEGAPLQSAMALAHTAADAVAVVESAFQIHGGLGYTWDTDVHLFARRVLADAGLMGSARSLCQEIADEQLRLIVAGRGAAMVPQ